jgi:mRNA interferase HigB
MVTISKGAIQDFVKAHPPAVAPLNDWYYKTKEADWSNFTEMKQTFGSVDAIGNDRFVFNIGGNNYRLVSMIHFDIRTVYIRRILTHAEYSVKN